MHIELEHRHGERRLDIVSREPGTVTVLDIMNSRGDDDTFCPCTTCVTASLRASPMRVNGSLRFLPQNPVKHGAVPRSSLDGLDSVHLAHDQQ